MKAVSFTKTVVVMIGVMARLLSDYGLQFAENFVYQTETAIFPNDSLRGNEAFEMIGEGGSLGDAVLPDEFHRGFRLRLPSHLPPSTIFLSTNSSTGPGLVGDSPWGLTYYVYAYINHAPSTTISSVLTAPFAPYNSTVSGRKSSKVFLSFTKSLVSHPETILKEQTAPAQSVSKTLMPSSKPISLDAALERPFYYANDVMSVHVKIDNPRAAALGGLRITLKQLITTRCLNESKHVTKLPLTVYEFPLVDENGKFISNNSGNGCILKDYPFIIDTVRVQLKPGNFLQQVAVESRLPRNAIRELILAPSFEQSYEFGNSNLRYFSIQYYMNVHVIVPWGSNLIAKLPFTIASKGASESLSSSDNLTSLYGSAEVVSPEDDFEDEDLTRAKSSKKSSSESNSDEFKRALKVFPKERLWREFDASLRLLDALKSSHSTKQLSSPSSWAFEASRRTWTRELAEAGLEVKAKIDCLAGLVCVTEASLLTQNDFIPSAIHTSTPKDLLETLKTRFLPAYFKLVSCHEEVEHRDAMQEAFNLLLDTLELVYMKFHLSLPGPVNQGTQTAILEVDSDFSGDQLMALIKGRLMRDFTRLILVIPGLVEWRWLLEGSLKAALQLGQGQWSSDCALELSDALLYSALNEDETEDLNYRLATAFQSIHDRLTQSFTDAQITPVEIVHYGRLLATLFSTKNDLQVAHMAAAHYAYFKVALFVYFGSFGPLMLPFDSALKPPIGPLGGQLKELREALKTLRLSLIESMQQ